MNLYYTLRDAEEWAAFSGDYNPIHFDLQYARQIGVNQLSVHGMRAMLDMKRYLSAALLVTAPEQDYYVFSMRMRRPVLCQTPYDLQITGNSAPVSGKLLASTTQENCFSSKLTSAPPLVLPACSQENTLSATEVMEHARRFPGEAFELTQTWSFFDALLFQLLMKSPETLATLSTALPDLNITTLNDIFVQMPVVQTHHDTHFSATFFNPASSIFHLEEPLYYAIQPMLIMGDKNNGFVLRTVIQARTQQQPLIMTAVTLKTWPLAAN